MRQAAACCVAQTCGYGCQTKRKFCRGGEHLFRHESGKMVATLTGIFGIEHFDLAEDVVQEALARALQTWPFYGVPKNPAAWIMRASRNLAVDVVRREKVFRDKEAEIIRLIDRENPTPDTAIFPNRKSPMTRCG